MNIINILKKYFINRRSAAIVCAATVMTGSCSAVAIDKTMDLTVDNLTYTATVNTLEEIPYDIIRKANDGMAKGETATVREGSNGIRSVEYKVFYTDGVETERVELSSETMVAPIDKIVEYGTAQENGPDFEYKYVIECTATAYDPSPEENGGYGGQSATGIPLQKGVIAVDPKVIPLGSRVYVEALDGSWSYGYAVAGDTGGAIKGNRVDLLYPTKSECYQFGRRKCRVYVL